MKGTKEVREIREQIETFDKQQHINTRLQKWGRINYETSKLVFCYIE